MASMRRVISSRPDAALAWVETTDDPNARLIASTRDRADACFTWDDTD